MHENNFSDLENFQENTTVFQTNTNASLKNLEIQVGQLAQDVQKEPKDSFPSDTRKNPKDYMAVILRSGRELDERRVAKTSRKRNKHKLEKNLSSIVQKLLRNRKQQKCSPRSRGRRKKLKLTILQFHSLKDCKKKS